MRRWNSGILCTRPADGNIFEAGTVAKSIYCNIPAEREGGYYVIMHNMSLLCQYGQSSFRAGIMLLGIFGLLLSESENGSDFHGLSLPHL